MIKRSSGIRSSLFGSAALAFALLNAGCGGTTTSASSATPTSPFALGINDASPTGAEASGLGLPTNPTNPSASDVGYDTYATAITPLNGAPKILVDPATVSGQPATPLGGPVPPGQAGVTFRADIAVGQTSNGGTPGISSAVLTSTDPEWTLGTLPLTFQYNSSTAAGAPGVKGIFSSATYSTAVFTVPFTTTGTHTVSVTVTDTAGRSTRTDYAISVAPPVAPPVVVVPLAIKHK